MLDYISRRTWIFENQNNNNNNNNNNYNNNSSTLQSIIKMLNTGVACGNATHDVLQNIMGTHDVLPQMAKHHGLPMMFCH